MSLQHLLDVVLHLDAHLNDWAASLGPWTYVLLFAIVFAETELVVTPFLPGDSLLFAVGALAATEGSPIEVVSVAVLLIVAAIVGDALKYSIGKYVGPEEGALRAHAALLREARRQDDHPGALESSHVEGQIGAEDPYVGRDQPSF